MPRELGDAAAAEARFVRALELDATHVPSMTALVEIYRKNGEFLKAAKLLRRGGAAHDQSAGAHAAARRGRRDLRRARRQQEGDRALSRRAGGRSRARRGGRARGRAVVARRALRGPGAGAGDADAQGGRVAGAGRAAGAARARGASGSGSTTKWARPTSRAAELDPKNLQAQRGRAELALEHGQWAEALAGAGADLPESRRRSAAVGEGRAVPAAGRLRAEARAQRARPRRIWAARWSSIRRIGRRSCCRWSWATAQPESLIDAKKALLADGAPTTRRSGC